MDLLEAIEKRKSIRNFLPRPVNKETVTKILDVAVHAPSAMNTQPWEFYVLSGKVLDAVREENVKCLRDGVMPEPEHMVVSWPRESVYRTRQVDLAKQIFSLMNIAREDKEKRNEWMERGFRYFDAPVAIIVLAEKKLSEAGPLLDIGCLIQNICLAALAHDLGTCIEDQGVMYPKVLRKIAGLPEDRRIIMALALGYPDWDFPANKIESARIPARDITTWFGFED